MAMVQKRVVVPETAWRSTVRRLGWFTVGELAAALGCSKGTAKRHLDELAALDPPLVKPHGRLGRDPMYQYIKPSSAGEGFERQRQQRFARAAPEAEVVLLSERNGEVRQSRIDSISDKEIQKVCRRAIADGWALEQTGGEHIFRLVKKGMRPVTVPSTPRNSQAAADMMSKKLSERSTHQRLRATG